MTEQRSDTKTRDRMDKILSACETSHLLVADAIRRGRNLKRWTIVLCTWLTLTTFVAGAVAIRASHDAHSLALRIQSSRYQIFLQQCEAHDATTMVQDHLYHARLKRAAGNQTLIADATERHESSRSLVNALAPRNPKKKNDNRPCTVIARTVAG